MKRTQKLMLTAWTICLLASCYNESELLVNADFNITIANANYTAPVRLTLENSTTGADFFKWSFEGGNPSTSDEKTPGTITYSKAGTYHITLEAWNNHERGTKTMTFSVDSAVTVSFATEVLINDFAPATVDIANTTQGASSFLWTFEGGSPATSTQQHPAGVVFEQPGTHTITLVAGNGREEFTLSRTITLKQPLAVDFDITPSFDDFDYEVPFVASLLNKTISGLTYEWMANGGEIADGSAEHTSIRLVTPGTYTVTLTANNGKERKTAVKEVTVRANSNLYTLTDVKLGIKAAVNTIGSFYSLKQRAVIPQSSVTESNGKEIDLVFFGINPTFEKCYFTSPDLAGNAGFYHIPGAATTYFVNTMETSGLSFSSSDFDAMRDDAPLRSLDIKQASNATSWFIAYPVPRIILFETADGRKGAVKIKAFVSDQAQSHILTDMKFQKEHIQ